ncbi:BMP family ABC transporter substrate-binding protein [Blastococcus sp. TF02-8]|uniref:BMP family lipoprotein n=1 Tax=Blastococcus sp. TF02-8 TaxID=2250574 RepID=UPI000DEABE5E|nr:BMP family ABC transporter substrate-binding protein [Blastococcus sp. TF02-8]RBY93480.1 BMP family ABC transporter substrate-binding protein [Blastococcus sp. TF02-8]
MTKAAALLLAGSLALVACASDEKDSGAGSKGGSDGDLKIGLAFDTGGRGDQSFNDSAVAGVEKAIKDLGGKVQELSPNDDASNRAELLTQLAEAGYNPVIAVGFNYDDVIAEVAPQFPDTTFAQVDGSNADGKKGDNVTGLLFAEEQGSFLAGVAAALKTETNNVGFVGGVQSPLIEKFQAGFQAGAKAVKPDIQVQVQYLSPAGDFSGFGDPQKGKLVAQGMYQNGADIVFHAAGGSGKGVFEAAVEAGKRAIGVDSDQYLTASPDQQAVIMTSMLKRVDNAVENFIKAYAEGDVEGATDIVNDLSTGGVGLATSGGYIDDIADQIKDFEKKILDGDITVPTKP